jgi:hypothetical protein
MSWNYQGEWDGTGERPSPPTWTSPEVVRDEKGRAVLDDDGTTKYEHVELTGEEVQAVRPHIGLIAEDVASVFPEVVTKNDNIEGGLLLGTNDTLGILWNAMQEEVIITDSKSLKQPRGISGGSHHGTVIDSMPVPPQPPTDGALIYAFGGDLWAVLSTGVRKKII